MIRASQLRGIARQAWPYSILTVVVVAVLWWVATRGARPSGTSLPSPHETWQALQALATRGLDGATLGSSVAVSVRRLLLGWLFSVILGSLVGLLMGSNDYAHRLLNPWVQFYRSLPPLAYLSLIVIWFGVGERSKVIVLLLGGLPPMILGTAAAVGAVRIERVLGARSLGLSRLQVLLHVTLPSVLPAVITSSRIAFGFAFATLIGAEMIAANSGIAYLVLTATNEGLTSLVVAGVVVMAAVAFVGDRLLRVLYHFAVPWAGRS